MRYILLSVAKVSFTNTYWSRLMQRYAVVSCHCELSKEIVVEKKDLFDGRATSCSNKNNIGEKPCILYSPSYEVCAVFLT